jgi:transcriptional regulator with XRE-family HTH domain
VTQEQLEELTGVSQGMISRLERGEIQRPNLEFVRAIGAALDTPYEELVGALFGSQFKAGAMVEADEILAKWRVLDIPPDVTSDELLLLKHLFRGIRGYRAEMREPRFGSVAPRATRDRARVDHDLTDQPALLPGREKKAEPG